MSCTNCKSDDCFEVDSQDCAKGCNEPVDTDCVFLNLSNKTASKLPNIGITKGSTLTYVLKKFDDLLGNSASANFSTFNLNGLNVGTEIKTLKQFSEAITLLLKNIDGKFPSLAEDIEDLSEDLESLTSLLESLIKINVSNSTLQVNSTDEIRTVINKIMSYLEDIEIPSQLEFKDSNTIEFNYSSSQVSGDVKIDPDPNNIISKTDEGLYAANRSVSSILDSIKNNETLKAVFSTLVSEALPCFSFDIMSNTNSPIKYINCLGTEVTTTARANVLLKLTDVKRIITAPSESLKITFKGI